MVDNTARRSIIKTTNGRKCKLCERKEDSLRVLKPVIGILLIVVSAVGLIWWEKYGREEFLMTEILVAERSIEKGEVVSEEHFQVIKIMKENLIEGAITSKSKGVLNGKISNQFIPKNGQICEDMFLDQEQLIGENQSIYVIKPHWIHARSSSLRKGDTIEIFVSDGSKSMGTFVVAYAKDEEEQEVVTSEGSEGNEILQRDFSSGIIRSVEIIAELQEYEAIRALAEEQGLQFLIVQKGV